MAYVVKSITIGGYVLQSNKAKQATQKTKTTKYKNKTNKNYLIIFLPQQACEYGGKGQQAAGSRQQQVKVLHILFGATKCCQLFLRFALIQAGGGCCAVACFRPCKMVGGARRTAPTK